MRLDRTLAFLKTGVHPPLLSQHQKLEPKLPNIGVPSPSSMDTFARCPVVVQYEVSLFICFCPETASSDHAKTLSGVDKV